MFVSLMISVLSITIWKGREGFFDFDFANKFFHDAPCFLGTTLELNQFFRTKPIFSFAFYSFKQVL